MQHPTLPHLMREVAVAAEALTAARSAYCDAPSQETWRPVEAATADRRKAIAVLLYETRKADPALVRPDLAELRQTFHAWIDAERAHEAPTNDHRQITRERRDLSRRMHEETLARVLASTPAPEVTP